MLKDVNSLKKMGNIVDKRINQTGGEIIFGYCTYHCHLRGNGKEEVTTMN